MMIMMVLKLIQLLPYRFDVFFFCEFSPNSFDKHKNNHVACGVCVHIFKVPINHFQIKWKNH